MTVRLSSAVAGLALVLTAGVAQAQQTTPTQPNGRPEAGMQRGRGMRDGMGARGLLRGVNLTDEQKQRVRAIHEKYQNEGKGVRESLRPAMEEARAARQRGDSAAARKAWDRTADQRRQLVALQERQMSEVRGVLTAEQQRQFDANRTAMQARMKERRAEGGNKRGGAARDWRGRAG